MVNYKKKMRWLIVIRLPWVLLSKYSSNMAQGSRNVCSAPGREAKYVMGYPLPSFGKASIQTDKETNCYVINYQTANILTVFSMSFGVKVNFDNIPNFGPGTLVCLFELTPSRRKEVGIPIGILPHIQKQNKRSYFPRPGQS